MAYKAYIAYLILSIAFFNIIGQTLLKSGADRKSLNLYLAAGVVSYGVSLLIYMTVLGKIHLSAAYPTVIGLTILGTVASGFFIFKEVVPPLQVMGILFILLGVFFFVLNGLVESQG